MDASIRQAIEDSAAIPSMPQVVTRFLEVIQDPNFDYVDVTRVLSVDAGTVSEILRLANSAMFSLTRQVTSLEKALTLLGPRRTRSLVLGRYLVEAISARGGDIDTSYFWRRSLAGAVLASRLAGQRCPRLKEEAFLGTLLADIGVTILAQALPSRYQPFARRYCPHGGPITVAEEQAALGTTHAEVSALVLGNWLLPESMCHAVACSHDDAISAVDDTGLLARLLNAADQMARLLCEIPGPDECRRVCTAALALIELPMGDLAMMLGDVEAGIEELAAVLRIDVIPSTVYARIADALPGQVLGIA